MTERKRSPYWDNVKALLIILVVFGHFMYELNGQNKWFDYMFEFIYMFHMPAFIFVSGYFGKSENSRSGRSLIKLLCAYFLFNSLFIVWGAIGGNTIKFATPYYSYWYLPALVVWRITVPYVSRLRGALPITVAAALFVGFCDDVTDVLALRRIIAFCPFFLAGYLLKEERMEKLLSASRKKRFLISVPVLLTGAGLAFAGEKLFDYTDTQLMMGSYKGIGWQAPTARLFVFVIAAVIILGIILLVPDKKLPVLTKAGRNSLAVYLIHRPAVLLLTDPIARLDGGKMMLAVICLLTVLMVIVLSLDFVSRILNGVLDFGADVIFRCGGKSGKRLINAACFAIYSAVALAVLCSPFI